MKTIPIGTQGTVSHIVDGGQTASAIKSGSLAILATPALAAQMEEAACRAIAPFLEGDETTVGAALSLVHSAPTPTGMCVRVTAEVTAVEGRKISFSIRAEDDCGEIGTATHERVPVTAGRFSEKARQRRTPDTKGSIL